MNTQLVGDHLAHNPEYRHGLYVVGCYLCDRWQKETPKQCTRRHQLQWSWWTC
jgi:hypothetical protein